MHERIPMVTPDEQRALRLENAKDNERFWTGMQAMNEGQACGNQEIAAMSEKRATVFRSEATKAAANAATARERIGKLEKGEDGPGGLGKPMTGKDMERMMRGFGWTTSDFQHASDLAELGELGAFDEYCDASSDATEKATSRIEKRIARKMLRERLNRYRLP